MMSRQTPIESEDTTSYPQIYGRKDGIAGTALIEFTLFAPLLVVMSIYTMDFGLFFFRQMQVQNAAQAGVDWAMANHIFNNAAISGGGD